MPKTYPIAIAGPGEYDDVVAEIDCSPAFMAIVRNEAGKYFLEVFNFEPSQIDGFSNGQLDPRNTVELDDFLRAIERAKGLLAYQSKPNI